MVNICFTFSCAFFPSFISNTSIVSINFRANLDVQNARNGISGLQISKIFWGSIPTDPPIHAWYVGHTMAFAHCYPPQIYYLTERSLFKKCPPHRKILKEGPEKKINKEIALTLFKTTLRLKYVKRRHFASFCSL